MVQEGLGTAANLSGQAWERQGSGWAGLGRAGHLEALVLALLFSSDSKSCIAHLAIYPPIGSQKGGFTAKRNVQVRWPPNLAGLDEEVCAVLELS